MNALVDDFDNQLGAACLSRAALEASVRWALDEAPEMFEVDAALLGRAPVLMKE
jgi:hypothetical protein